jgi:2'-5' RNA ligase
VAEEAIAVSREIAAKHRVYFTLDGVQFFPHITLHLPEYPQSNVEKVLQKVEEIAQTTPRIKLHFLQIMIVDGYLGIEFECSPEIKKLHMQVVGKLNPLWEEHPRAKYRSGSDLHMSFTPGQWENIKKYGAPDVVKLYQPHLTITRLRSCAVAEKLAENLKWKTPIFTVDSLAVYTMGEHGTCKELMSEFGLK